MTDLKRINKILKHIDNLENFRFLDGIKYELVTKLQDRKTHLEYIKDNQECLDCGGKGGHLESYNDGMGRDMTPNVYKIDEEELNANATRK